MRTFEISVTIRIGNKSVLITREINASGWAAAGKAAEKMAAKYDTIQSKPINVRAID